MLDTEAEKYVAALLALIHEPHSKSAFLRLFSALPHIKNVIPQWNQKSVLHAIKSLQEKGLLNKQLMLPPELSSEISLTLYNQQNLKNFADLVRSALPAKTHYGTQPFSALRSQREIKLCLMLNEILPLKEHSRYLNLLSNNPYESIFFVNDFLTQIAFVGDLNLQSETQEFARHCSLSANLLQLNQIHCLDENNKVAVVEHLQETYELLRKLSPHKEGPLQGWEALLSLTCAFGHSLVSRKSSPYSGDLESALQRNIHHPVRKILSALRALDFSVSEASVPLEGFFCRLWKSWKQQESCSNVAELDLFPYFMTLVERRPLCSSSEKGTEKSPASLSKKQTLRLQYSYTAKKEDLCFSGSFHLDWFDVRCHVTLKDGSIFDLTAHLAKNSPFPDSVEVSTHTSLLFDNDLRDRLQEISQLASNKDASSRLRIKIPVAQSAFAFIEPFLDLESSRLFQDFQEKAQAPFNVTMLATNVGELLRPYQREGVEWLLSHASHGRGVCLADDMGLGKTLQTLAVLSVLTQKGPALVVAPTSVCGNWISEVKKFTPDLKVCSFEGPQQSPEVLAAGANTLVVVSYARLQLCYEIFAQKNWHTIVLDEAHFIKNAVSQRAHFVWELKGHFRLALTGTPIENHPGELWSLFRFLEPSLLGSASSFRKRFLIPLTKQNCPVAKKSLRQLISPYLLRRMKSQVLPTLPPATEKILYVSFNQDERNFYENLQTQARNKLNAMSLEIREQGKLAILADLTRLRRACCSPHLVDKKATQGESKRNSVLELVERLRATGQRMVIFSQFVDHLHYIREAFTEKQIPFLYFDGATSPEERNKRIDAFQNGCGDVFLISLRAGGFGINLTSADAVLLLDPWWNPAVESQAIDRTRRIGQLKPVTIYRFVTEATIEEKILELQQKKLTLANGLFEEKTPLAPFMAEVMDLLGGA